MTVSQEFNLNDLDKPFAEKDLEWRISRSGVKGDKTWATCLVYITARAIHDRLDEVCGKGLWQSKYHDHLGGTICQLGIKVDGEWIWKSGGSGETQFEAFKGGLSGAEKRAGVPWGIGRYLYNLDEGFAEIATNGKYYQAKQSAKNGKPEIPSFKWNPPKLPAWALPDTTVKKLDKDEKPKGDLEGFLKLMQSSTSLEDLRIRYEEYKKYTWTQDEFKEIEGEKGRLKISLQGKSNAS